MLKKKEKEKWWHTYLRCKIVRGQIIFFQNFLQVKVQQRNTVSHILFIIYLVNSFLREEKNFFHTKFKNKFSHVVLNKT